MRYFNCFRFMKRGNPCTYCFTNQLNMLHCLDSRESECHCVVCDQLPHMHACCEDYPEEESTLSDDDYASND